MTSTYKAAICNIARLNYPADELQRAALPVYWVIYDTTDRAVLGRYKTELEALEAHADFMAKIDGNPIIADPLHGIMEDARRNMFCEVGKAVTAARQRGNDVSIFDLYPLPGGASYDI